MFRLFAFLIPSMVWLYVMRDFVAGSIPVNMDTNTIYGVTKFYFNNLLNGVVPLWDPFVSLGRPFYAIVLCNLFNPITQIVPLLKICGMDYAHAFIMYMLVYFFIGLAGFYLLALEIFQDKLMAYLAFVGLLFSSLGGSMFTQFTFLEMVVPAIWLFYFLMRFARRQSKANFLGMAFCKMLLISAYLPFYFVTVFGCFLLAYLCLYFKEAKNFWMVCWRFMLKHWRLTLVSVAAGLVVAGPLLAYKMLDASGDSVSPGRHCQYSSAQQCYDRTMNEKGGMSYQEITQSGSLAERLDVQDLFGNLDKISYGSDSFFFLPVWIFILLGLSLFLPLTRLTVLLTATIILVGMVGAGDAAGLHHFLYTHVFFFAYFRNLFFFGAFLMPLVILLAIHQLQMLLKLAPTHFSTKKTMVVGIIFLHLVLYFLLKQLMAVPTITYVTLILSAIIFSLFYSGIIRISTKVWVGVFALLLVVQPLMVLKTYAFNAHGFASTLPSMHVKPEFSFLRPLKPAVSDAPIYQFVHYEDFWYDMSMTDAPPVIGYPQSAARWTFDLAQHTPPAELAYYAQYKLVLYDSPSSGGQPVLANSSPLTVEHFDVNDLRLATNFSKPQRLVYNDSYTSSWKVYVDHVPAILLRANGAFKGVDVPAGGHEVKFVYSPPGGTWVYLAATAVLFIFLLGLVLMLNWELQ